MLLLSPPTSLAFDFDSGKIGKSPRENEKFSSSPCVLYVWRLGFHFQQVFFSIASSSGCVRLPSCFLCARVRFFVLVPRISTEMGKVAVRGIGTECNRNRIE